MKKLKFISLAYTISGVIKLKKKMFINVFVIIQFKKCNIIFII